MSYPVSYYEGDGFCDSNSQMHHMGGASAYQNCKSQAWKDLDNNARRVYKSIAHYPAPEACNDMRKCAAKQACKGMVHAPKRKVRVVKKAKLVKKVHKTVVELKKMLKSHLKDIKGHSKWLKQKLVKFANDNGFNPYK